MLGAYRLSWEIAVEPVDATNLATWRVRVVLQLLQFLSSKSWGIYPAADMIPIDWVRFKKAVSVSNFSPQLHSLNDLFQTPSMASSSNWLARNLEKPPCLSSFKYPLDYLSDISIGHIRLFLTFFVFLCISKPKFVSASPWSRSAF